MMCTYWGSREGVNAKGPGFALHEEFFCIPASSMDTRTPAGKQPATTRSKSSGSTTLAEATPAPKRIKPKSKARPKRKITAKAKPRPKRKTKAAIRQRLEEHKDLHERVHKTSTAPISIYADSEYSMME